MSLLHSTRARTIACCAAAIALLGSLALAPGASASNFGNSYLALGDSLAYGYHGAQFAQELKEKGFVEPATFNDGYVDDFGAYMKGTNPKQTTINDGCPGETSETMIKGSGKAGFCAGGATGTPFPYPFLHHPYATGTQLSDAVELLKANPGISPITLDMGANDVLQFLASKCGFPKENKCSEAEVIAQFTHIIENVGFIIGTLRAAAPMTPIILVGLYNPTPLVSPPPGGDSTLAALNGQYKTLAEKFSGVTFVNPEPIFNPSTGKGFAFEAEDIPSICAYTAMCPGGTYNPASPEADIHPTKLGYLKMAELIEGAFPGPRYYRNGMLVGETNKVVEWGDLQLKTVVGGTAEATCHTVSTGNVEDPTNGNGVGSTQTLVGWECEGTKCPHQTFVEGYSVPWSGLLQQEGLQPFAPSKGMKLIVECRSEGGVTETKEALIGALTGKWMNGMSANKPSSIQYGASSGTLEQEGSGGALQVQVTGTLKVIGFGQQETITIK